MDFSLDDIGRELKKQLEGFDLKTQIGYRGELKWVNPKVSIDPTGDYSDIAFDPEIWVRSGTFYDEDPVEQAGDLEKRVLNEKGDEIDLYTMSSVALNIGYNIEVLSKDPVLRESIKTRLLLKYKRVNGLKIPYGKSGKNRAIWFIRTGIKNLDTDKIFRTVFSFLVKVVLLDIKKETLVANKTLKINLRDKSSGIIINTRSE